VSSDSTFIVLWLFGLWLLGWLALPLVRRIFSPLPDGGLAAGRVLALALVCLLAFWGAALKLMPLLLTPLLLFGLPLVGSAMVLRRSETRQHFVEWLRVHRHALIFSDVLFIVAFLFFAWVRLRHPQINDLEKPMDSALIGQLARATYLPPQNPWMSGTLFTNYYYFGHLMGGVLERTFATPNWIAYNLVQPAFCAFFVSTLWSLCAALTGSLWRGVAAMSAVSLLGHFEPLRQWLVPNPDSTGNLFHLDWWRTSRVIPDTINEYPAFTMLSGDAHAHFFALALAALFFCVCHALLYSQRDAASGATPRRTRWLLLSLIGLLLGIFAMTNTWDVPTYGLLGVLVTALALWSDKQRQRWEWLLILAPLVLSRIVAWPYTKDFRSPVSGAKLEVWSPQGTSFMLLWGGFLAAWCLFLVAERTRQSTGPATKTLWTLPAVFVGVLIVVQVFVPSLAIGSLAVTFLLFVFTLLPGTTKLKTASTSSIGCAASEVETSNATESRHKTAKGKATKTKAVSNKQSKTRLTETKQPKTSSHNNSPQFLYALALLGLLALLAPMFFYIRGAFGEGQFRHQDTVFKFGAQAWLLLGTAASCGALLWWNSWRSRFRWVLPLLVVPVPLLCSLCVLWTRVVRDAPRDVGGRFVLSLNGARHLPLEDQTALAWLRSNVPADASVLEAVGETPEGAPGGDYTEFARVSSLTGIPTPLGWSGGSHLPAWGADMGELARRFDAVKVVFAWPDDVSGKAALRALGVRYVFIGDLERRTYPLDALARLRSALPIEYSQGDTFIARVPES
jgi:YYY domain-containing protein